MYEHFLKGLLQATLDLPIEEVGYRLDEEGFDTILSPAGLVRVAGCYPFDYSESHLALLDDLVAQNLWVASSGTTESPDPFLGQEFENEIRTRLAEKGIGLSLAIRLLTFARLELHLVELVGPADALVASNDIPRLRLLQLATQVERLDENGLRTIALVNRRLMEDDARRKRVVRKEALDLYAKDETEPSSWMRSSWSPESTLPTADPEDPIRASLGRRADVLVNDLQTDASKAVEIALRLPLRERAPWLLHYVKIGLLGELGAAAEANGQIPLLEDLAGLLPQSSAPNTTTLCQRLAELGTRRWLRSACAACNLWEKYGFTATKTIQLGNGQVIWPRISRRHEDLRARLLRRTGELVDSCPSGALVACLRPADKSRFKSLRFRLLLAREELDSALEELHEIGDASAQAYRAMAVTYIDAVGRRNGSNAIFDPNFPTDSGNARPLTRPRDGQYEALARLSEDLARIRTLPGCADIDEVAVEAFAEIYSLAEVFLEPDIEAVFGPINDLSSEVALAIADVMLTRLGGVWGNQKVQIIARTDRTEDEVRAELVRGHALLEKILDAARPSEMRHSDVWRFTLRLAQSNLLFAEIGSIPGEAPDVSRDRRERALQVQFPRAVQEYRSWRSTFPGAERTIEPFQVWFRALALSDSGLTPANTDEIAKALASLSAEEEEWTRAELTRWFQSAIRRFPPERKYQLSTAFLRLATESPATASAKRLIEKCDEVAKQTRVHVELDGGHVVGQGEPFGFRLSLRYTRKAASLSGGFGRYLRDELDNGILEDRSPVDYRADIETRVRLALGERFRIRNYIYHDPDSDPKRLEGADEGWFETPIAYVVASAVDRSVSAIPPILLDLDFFRRDNVVILPFASPRVPLDASKDPERLRPLHNVQLTQTLDERSLEAEELLRVDVRLTAVGTVPSSLEKALRLEQLAAPFEILKVNPEEPTQLGMDEALQTPTFELAGEIILRTTRVEPGSDFTFFDIAAGAPDDTELRYQRFPLSKADTDIETVARTTPLVQWYRAPSPRFWIALGAVPIILLLGWHLARRRPRRGQVTRRRYSLPPSVGGTSISFFLRRLSTDPAVVLSEDARAALERDILRVEEMAFAENGSPLPQEELARLANDWVHRANTSPPAA